MATPEITASPYATVEDVAIRLATSYSGDQEAQVEALIADISSYMRSVRPLLDQWIAAGLVSADAARAVCCQATARMLTSVHTGGMGVIGESHPEYSYQLSQAAAAGMLLTEDELNALTPFGPRRAFSIQPA